MSKAVKCPMSPLEAASAIKLVGREISDKCEIHVWLSTTGYRDRALIASVGAQGGYPAETTFRVEADSFEELIDNIRNKWAEHSDEYARQTTSAMALEIIRLTDELGECSDAALRAGEFTYSDVAKFGAAACVRAAEMASKGPFSIVTVSGANAKAA